MKYFTALFILIITTLDVNGQHKIELSDYNSVDVFGAVEVELIKSDKHYVEIEYNGVSKDEIIADVNSGVLRLKIKNRHYFDDWSSEHNYNRSDYVKVKAYYVELEAIEGQAAAIITSRSPVKSKNLYVDCSMGAEIDLELVAQRAKLKSSMGGILTLTGKIEYIDIRANMGGELKASRLKARIANVSASMGAEVRINVEDEIEVSSSLGAEVYYAGSPSVKHVSRNLGGEVNHR
jgi:hypothetical protein